MQGHQARVSAFQGKDDVFWRVVSVMHGDRIGFQVYIGRKDKMSSPTVARFFNSLKLSSR